VVTIVLFGERATGELLVLSQVILSLQLSFAVVPLVHLVSDRRWMGEHAIGPRLAAVAWAVALTIAGLNLSLAYDEITGWLRGAGEGAWILWSTVVPLAVALLCLLLYVAVQPAVRRLRGAGVPAAVDVHGATVVPPVLPAPPPRRVAVAVDFSPADQAALSHASGLLRVGGGELVLLHVVESGGARLLGAEAGDRETSGDAERLAAYARRLGELGVAASWQLGFGEPVDVLAELVEAQGADLVVLGSHGHGAVGDLLLGTSVERLRHRLRVPLVVVPMAAAAGAETSRRGRHRNENETETETETENETEND
jgi:manganese transport protein